MTVPVPTGLVPSLDRISQTSAPDPGQVIAAGNNTLIFSNVQTGTNYDTSTGIWTAPANGICIFSIIVGGNLPAGSYGYIVVTKNAYNAIWSEWCVQNNASGLAVGCTVSRSLEVAANDQIQPWFYSPSGNPAVGANFFNNDFMAASFLFMPTPGPLPSAQTEDMTTGQAETAAG